MTEKVQFPYEITNKTFRNSSFLLHFVSFLHGLVNLCSEPIWLGYVVLSSLSQVSENQERQ